MDKLIPPIAIFLMFATFIGVNIYCYLNSPTTWHLVQIQEGTTQKYTIESCHRFSGCRLTGYRYDITDKGLAEAEDTFSYFVKVDPPTRVLKVIE